MSNKLSKILDGVLIKIPSCDRPETEVDRNMDEFSTWEM